MKRLSFLMLLTIVVKASLYAQIQYFAEFSGNYSMIPAYEKEEVFNSFLPATGYSSIAYPRFKIAEYYDSKPGFDFLLGVQKKLPGRFSAETGFGLSVVNFKRNIEVRSMETGNIVVEENTITGLPIGVFFGQIQPGDIKFIDVDNENEDYRTLLGNPSNTGKTTISYLSIPLILNYAVIKNRLLIGTGISSSLLVHSRQTVSEIHMESSLGTSPILERWGVGDSEDYPSRRITIAEKTDRSGSGLNNVIWNGHVNIQARLVKSVWINAGYQQSLSSLYDEKSRVAGDARNRLVRIGMRYYFKP